MPKGVRVKKDLDINVDTKNVDVKVTRKDNNTDVHIDTKNIDIDFTKDATGKKTVDVKVETGVVLEVIKRIIQRVCNRKRG